MVFKRQDIYTSSGTVMLQNSWTPYVSKYDTSSFYNWEQDNLPLYDLEERTYENWEQQGFATSSVPGFSLTVSANTPTATLQANTTIFTDLQSCIAAIPKVVRFPVLVEVCNYGDLGDLELHNFRIEEGGSIEVINRGYSKAYNASSTVNGGSVVTPAKTRNAFTPLVENFVSQDVSATLYNGLAANTGTSGLAVATPVLSGAGDIRVSATNSFVYPKLTLKEAPLCVGLAQSDLLTGVANKFKVNPYENTVSLSVDNTLGTADMSATNQATAATLKRASISTDSGQAVGGSIYLNTLDKISVQNCDGPIYIRNFCVNGESAVGSGRKVGIEVTNSDVLLENCAAARCREAGFKFNNSKVVLSRSAFSYRNYELTSVTSRKSQTGIGFHAINSDVSISALVEASVETGNPNAGDYQASGDDIMVLASRNYAGFKLDNSKLHGGFQRIVAISEPTGGITGAEQNTGYGFIVNNSEIDLKGLIDIYGNDKGMEVDTSKITYENLCIDYTDEQAIRARNSTFIFNSTNTPTNAGQSTRKQVDFHGNGQHLDLRDESSFLFARKNNIPTTYGNMQFSGCHGVIKWGGGNKANLPAISVDNNSVLNLVHADIRTREAADSVANSPSYGVGIKATNNSVASLFGTGSGCTLVWGVPGYTYQQKTAGVYANNGSEINLHGPTVMAQMGVNVLGENNSTINIQPPRVRDAYGLEASAFDLSSAGNHTSVELQSTRACLVVNKNSTLNLTDLGGFPNTWGTTANGLQVRDAGTDYPIGTYDNSGLTASGSLQFYPSPQNAGVIADNNLDNLLGNAYAATLPNFPVMTWQPPVNTFLAVDDPFGTGPTYDTRAELTQGGVCVRAAEDSTVNVLNVHFPIGTNASPLDGLYFDASGDDCSKFMIWNIADTSRLNAAFCSVSGMYPLDAQYHGPSAIYASSVTAGAGQVATNANDIPAYGAPNNTPDTGSLSILDAFGAGSGVLTIPSGVDFNSPFDRFYAVSGGGDGVMYDQKMNPETVSALVGAGINVSGNELEMWGAGPHVSNNRGPFRLYWSPDSTSKVLQTDMSGYQEGAFVPGRVFSGVVGPAYQIFAQGYNCSAELSAIQTIGTATNTSSVYPSLLKLSVDTNNDGCPTKLHTSGFYYCKEFMEDDPTQCMLDESAGFTFANAQNASLGLGGRPRRVTIYRSRSDAEANRGSEAYPGDASGAVGFKSANIFDLKRDN
jgi:hypothetical protein